MNVLRAIKSSLHGRLVPLGIDIRRLRPDRQVLERIIFPFLNDSPALARILFVGCAWYTQHYPRIFAAKDFWTLECDPAQARFGSRRHVIDRCERVAAHFPPGHLDAVVCNGVYGYGLNDAGDLRRAGAGFHEVLRPGGLLIFGWNNVPAHDPLGLGVGRDGVVFPGFVPARSSPFGGWRHEVPSRNRHTYEFLERA
jgi:SAM-dependent methyltransferase